MRHGWLIYDRTGININEWFADRMLRCITELGDTVELKITDELTYGYASGKLCFFENGCAVTPPDFAVVRTADPLLSRHLESLNVRVFNPSYTSEICNDKRRTHEEIARLGIPMADTLFCDKRYFSYKNIEFPCVCKAASGHGGKEVFMVNSAEQLKETVEKLRQNEFLLQKPVSDLGIDIRAYVLGDKVVTCAKRVSVNDFRSNFSLGGSAVAVESEEVKKYALLAAKCVKADFVGVDFIFDGGKPLLNEIEDVVGTRMIYATTDIDICKEYAEYIHAVINNENN